MTVRPSKPLASKFLALEHAILLVQSLRDVSVKLRRHDASLEKQLRRAASSVALNLGEGRRRRGQDRTHLFRIAAGSAEEVRTCLRLVQAWGYLPDNALIRRLVMSIEYSN